MKKKITKSQLQEVMMVLSDLLENGFTLQESLQFMTQLMKKEQDFLFTLIEQIQQGYPFYSALEKLGVSAQIVNQIYFSEIHGDLPDTLKKVQQHLSDIQKRKQEFYKVISYPLLLLLFLFGMLAGMKWILLPKIKGMQGMEMKKNLGVILIEITPIIMSLGSLAAILIFLYLKHKSKRYSGIQIANYQVRIPLIYHFYISYYTTFFGMEWGKLLTQGLETKKILKTMKKGKRSWIQELAVELEEAIEQGIPFHKKIESCAFFHSNLSYIIQRGEAKGKLGEELIIYGKRTWLDLMSKIEKWINLLQPVIFIIIALLIVCVYAALLLPMYENMGRLY